MAETFTPDERAALAPYFTNLDGPVFALVNLPETVKGALFARYSRSPKSLRRLFLDEFLPKVGSAPLKECATEQEIGVARAEQLYDRVFNEYGDDSVAQLGGVHLACEDASNVLTKLVEWGRLMAYLEQSTRYIAYTQQREGRWRYHVPGELDERPRLRAQYVAALDASLCRLRALDRADAGALPRARSESARGFRRRLPVGDQGEGARHASGPAAGSHAVQCGHLRHRTGVRGALLLRLRASPSPKRAPAQR